MKPLDAFQSPKSQNSLVYESAFFNLFWEDVSRWLSVTFRLFPSPFSLLQRPSRPLKAEFSVFSSNGFDTCKNTCTMLRGEDTQEPESLHQHWQKALGDAATDEQMQKQENLSI